MENFTEKIQEQNISFVPETSKLPIKDENHIQWETKSNDQPNKISKSTEE